MNADRLDSLSERVLGAVFEVTNTLGAGFLEKVYQRALLRELGLRGIRACRRSFIYSHLQGPLCRRILCGSPRRRRVGSRTEMCGSVLQRAHCAVSQLSASLRGRGGVDTTWFVHPLPGHYTRLEIWQSASRQAVWKKPNVESDPLPQQVYV